MFTLPLLGSYDELAMSLDLEQEAPSPSPWAAAFRPKQDPPLQKPCPPQNPHPHPHPQHQQQRPPQRTARRRRRRSSSSVRFAPSPEVLLVSSLRWRRQNWALDDDDDEDDVEAVWHTEAEFELMKANVKRSVRAVRKGVCGEEHTRSPGAADDEEGQCCGPRCDCRLGIEHLLIAHNYRRSRCEKKRAVRAVLDEQDRQRRERRIRQQKEEVGTNCSPNALDRDLEEIRRVSRTCSKRAREEAERLGLRDAEDCAEKLNNQCDRLSEQKVISSPQFTREKLEKRPVVRKKSSPLRNVTEDALQHLRIT